MTVVSGDLARATLALIQNIGAGEDVDDALARLEGPDFRPLLKHLGEWQEGAMVPDRFIYILQRAVLGGGELQLAPREAWLESHFARALRVARGLGDVLDRLLKHLDKQLPAALEREVLAWLPKRVEPAPDVQIVLGTPWLMFTDQDIYLDLLGLVELGAERAEQLICHEVFHHCHRRIAESNGSVYPWLFELQSEGVAGHVIGGSRELWEACYRHAPGELGKKILARLEWYPRFAASIPESMDELWLRLAEGLGGSTDSLSAWYRDCYPGHHHGVFMAKVIEEELGRDALVKSLVRPAEFPALYTKAAANRKDLPAAPADLLAALVK